MCQDCWKGACSLVEGVCAVQKVAGSEARSQIATSLFYRLLTVVPEALLHAISKLSPSIHQQPVT